MGRVAVLRESNPFADFVRAFAPVAGQAMDERKKQEENAMLGQMYLDAYRAPADAASLSPRPRLARPLGRAAPPISRARSRQKSSPNHHPMPRPMAR